MRIGREIDCTVGFAKQPLRSHPRCCARKCDGSAINNGPHRRFRGVNGGNVSELKPTVRGCARTARAGGVACFYPDELARRERPSARTANNSSELSIPPAICVRSAVGRRISSGPLPVAPRADQIIVGAAFCNAAATMRLEVGVATDSSTPPPCHRNTRRRTA